MTDEAKDVSIIPFQPEHPPETTLAIQRGSLEEIEQAVKRAELLGSKLDRLRAIVVERTFPSDWTVFGNSVYLDGAGAQRAAPIIGLRLENLTKEIRVDEKGNTIVTMTADASSALFGTRYEKISRTRSSAEPYLQRGGEPDVVQAVYTSLVGKAVQMLAGLTGLTPEELKTAYGITAGGKVEFKSKKDAQTPMPAPAPPTTPPPPQTPTPQAPPGDPPAADESKYTNDQVAVQALLKELSGGDVETAQELLAAITKNDAKGWPGKTSVSQLTEKSAAWARKKLEERRAKAASDKLGGMFPG